jgi:uncharacterized coiled-coil protein SlyX
MSPNMTPEEIAKYNRDAAEHLQAQLKESVAEARKLQGTIAAHEQMIKRLHSELEIVRELRSEEEEERTWLLAEIPERELELKRLRSVIEVLNAEVDKAKAQAAEALAETVELRLDVSHLQTEREGYQARLASLDIQFDNQRARIRELEAQVARATSLIDGLKASLREAKERIVELQKPTTPDPPPPVVVDPPPAPTLPPGFSALELHGATMAQLKERALAFRPPLSGLIVARSTRMPVRGEELLFSGIDWTSPDRACLNVPRGGATEDITNVPARPLKLYRCQFRGDLSRPYNQPQYWLIRAYNIDELDIDQCRFTGDVRWSSDGRLEARPDEHAVYPSLVHGSMVTDSVFAHLGGHALHVASRPRDNQQYPPDNIRPTRPMSHLVERVGVVDVDMHPKRGAAALHYTDPGTLAHPCRIAIKDSIVALAWERWRGDGVNVWTPGRDASVYASRNCEAVLTVTPDMMMREHAEGAPGRPMCERVHIKNAVLARGFNPTKAFGYLRGVGELLIEDSLLTATPGGNNVIDIDDLDLPAWSMMAKITLRNCMGNVVLRKRMPDGSRMLVPAACPHGEITWELGMQEPSVR